MIDDKDGDANTVMIKMARIVMIIDNNDNNYDNNYNNNHDDKM